MIARIEVERAFKNCCKDGSPFGFKQEVVPLDKCLELVKEFWLETDDERDILIAELEAKVNVYENIIAKSNFGPLIKEDKKEKKRLWKK